MRFLNRWFKRKETEKPIIMPNGQPFLKLRRVHTYHDEQGHLKVVMVWGDGSADEKRQDGD